MKIGITESGDAALDYAWVNKTNSCDGIILITKNLTDDLINKIMTHPDKFIVHATCTGMGGTMIEPNVPDYSHQLAQIQKLLDAGFPEERVVVRLDPIVPTERGLKTAQKVIDAAPIKRFRISVLDTYPHVRERFRKAGVPLPYGENAFQATPAQFDALRTWLENQSDDCVFEACAEPKLSGTKHVSITGCVSANDLVKFGISSDEISGLATGKQRATCLCLSCKTELLQNKKRCPHGCLYCYWKD